MRHRKVANLDVRLEQATPVTIDNPEELIGIWKNVFKNDNPIYLEIGCGKGKFIAAHAEQDPCGNYLAIEGMNEVVVSAMEKAMALPEHNLYLIPRYVDDLDLWFADNELTGIYLNFSDPWPKARHEKRRLTYGPKLVTYYNAVKPGGFIEIKTDNDGLFEYTMGEIEKLGWKPAEYSDDLHASDYSARLITTEYEDKFLGREKNIHYVKIVKE